MTTSPFPLDIASGVIKTLSASAAKGRYVDSNHVRFRNGKAEKVGGCTKKVSGSTVDGLVRGMYSWTTQAGQPLDAGGTATKLYSISDALQDITPLRISGTEANNPFTTVSASTTVTVHHVANGLNAGAHVHWSGASAFNNVTMNGEFVVTVIVDADNYKVEAITTANASSSGGGAAVAYQYEINPGTADTIQGLGYGAGTYGSGTYGTPRTGITQGITQEFRYWSLDRYGVELAALPSGGTLYLWDEPGSAARATAVANAPNARAMFISAERLPMMLGATDGSIISPGPMTLAWPDVDDITIWTPLASNSADERILQGGSKLMGGCVYNQVNLMWSDTTLFVAQFLGDFSGLIYDTRPIAFGCGLIGPGAFRVTPQGVFWLSPNGFFMFTGAGVTPVPRFDEIKPFIFGAPSRVGHLNRDQATKSVVGYNPKFDEVWCFYAYDSATEPNYYFKCNTDFDFDVGTWTRTAMTSHAGADGSVILAGTNSVIYEHESGLDDDGAALESYVDTSEMSLDAGGSGDVDIEGFVPDFERQTGDLTIEIHTRDRSVAGTPYLEDATFTIPEGTGLVDVRMAGRWISARLTSDVLGGDYRLGLPAIEIGPGGQSR